MKISVIFFSNSGKTAETAAQIADGIKQAAGTVDIRLFNLKDGAVDAAYVRESAVVVFGSPTYMGNACGTVIQWFETRENCGMLKDKLGASFATAQYQQGGAGNAINTINNFLLFHGMLVYAGGGGMAGKPLTHMGMIALNDRTEVNREMAEAYGKRIGTKALELFA
ncbi:MAG: flavodoxin domain-containing protein [Lentisphaeria bacterium]